jgi:hypothetical protein
MLCYAVLCSDVICEYPLKEMMEFHKSMGAEGTLLVTKVCKECLTVDVVGKARACAGRGLEVYTSWRCKQWERFSCWLGGLMEYAPAST